MNLIEYKVITLKGKEINVTAQNASEAITLANIKLKDTGHDLDDFVHKVIPEEKIDDEFEGFKFVSQI